jgi:ABC-type lipoprotein export system ATPase subunit
MTDETRPALRMEAVRKVFHSGDDEVVAVDRGDLTGGAGEKLARVGAAGSG